MASRIVPEGGWSNPKPFKTPRVHRQPHLSFVKGLPCIGCLVERGVEIQADDPMHIRAGSPLYGKEPEGGSRTADDRWTLPGCRPHHDRQHAGAELTFWQELGVDPFLLALVLWGLTGNYHGAVLALRLHAGRAASQRVIDDWRLQTALAD